jgi:tetratricopeptide (TPR) repeat protein
MWAGFAVLLILAGPAKAETDVEQQIDWCNSEDSPDLGIAGCTFLIQSGQYRSEIIAKAFNNRGTHYYQKEQYARALADLDESIRLNPTCAKSLYNRGAYYNNKGEYDNAIADYDDVIELSQMYDSACYYDDSKDDVRDLLDPDEVINQAIELNKTRAEAFNGRCYARASVGALQQALADCNESLKLLPGDSDTLDSRGFSYLKLGQAAAAKADFDSALEQEPKLASSLYGRGLAEVQLSDPTAGRRDIAAAQRLDPAIAEKYRQRGVPPPQD